jgi:hypothetical protein
MRCLWERTRNSTWKLARDIAQRFNARYGETFVLPEHRISRVAARIMDLQVPDKKMSTTGGTELGTVLMLDKPDEIRRKFKSAVTDSERDIVRRDDKPGIMNLIEILAAVRGVEPEAVEQEYATREATRDSNGTSARRWWSCWLRCASATPKSGPTRRRSVRCSRRVPTEHEISPRRPSSSRGTA